MEGGEQLLHFDLFSAEIVTPSGGLKQSVGVKNETAVLHFSILMRPQTVLHV